MRARLAAALGKNYLENRFLPDGGQSDPKVRPKNSAPSVVGRAAAHRADRAPLVLVPEGDTPLGEIVRRHLEADLVSGQDADTMLSHLARHVGDYGMPVVQPDTKARIG